VPEIDLSAHDSCICFLIPLIHFHRARAMVNLKGFQWIVLRCFDSSVNCKVNTHSHANTWLAVVVDSPPHVSERDGAPTDTPEAPIWKQKNLLNPLLHLITQGFTSLCKSCIEFRNLTWPFHGSWQVKRVTAVPINTNELLVLIHQNWESRF